MSCIPGQFQIGFVGEDDFELLILFLAFTFSVLELQTLATTPGLWQTDGFIHTNAVPAELHSQPVFSFESRNFFGLLP